MGGTTAPLARRLMLAGLAAGLLLSARQAAAHAVLLDSTPAPGASVPAGPVDIALRFNSRIDAARSRLTLIGPGGAEITPALMTGASADRLVARGRLAAGTWSLRWQVLSTDGHITRGDLAFSVIRP